jgi:hypothetical protein
MGMMGGRGWCWRIELLGFERRVIYVCQCEQSNCRMEDVEENCGVYLRRFISTIYNNRYPTGQGCVCPV